MVTLTSAAQSLGSGVVDVINLVSGIAGAAVTAVVSALSSLGNTGSTLPAIATSGGISGLTSFGLPPVEVLQPALSTLLGFAEWLVVATLPLIMVVFSFITLLAALIPVAVAVLVGAIPAGVIGVVLVFVLGLATGWIGFIITPIMMMVAAFVALVIGFVLGGAAGLLIWLAEMILLLPAIGVLLTPLMMLGNATPLYFLNVLYLGVLGPFVAILVAVPILFVILIPFILIWEIQTLVTNIPAWAIVVGDIIDMVVAVVTVAAAVIVEIIIGVPIIAVAVTLALVILDIPIFLAALGMTGLNLLTNVVIPGPTSFGVSSGTVSAVPSDSVAGSIGSGGIAATATAAGTGATALTAGSLTTAFASLGLAGGALALMSTSAAGLLATVSRLPASAMTLISIPTQALSTAAVAMTGSAGMMTDIAGNRAIHAAIGVLQ